MGACCGKATIRPLRRKSSDIWESIVVTRVPKIRPEIRRTAITTSTTLYAGSRRHRYPSFARDGRRELADARGGKYGRGIGTLCTAVEGPEGRATDAGTTRFR